MLTYAALHQLHTILYTTNICSFCLLPVLLSKYHQRQTRLHPQGPALAERIAAWQKREAAALSLYGTAVMANIPALVLQNFRVPLETPTLLLALVQFFAIAILVHTRNKQHRIEGSYHG